MTTTSKASVPRCDYCGQLEWTLNIDGRVSHKHDCPNRVDDWCQAHPHGCGDWLIGLSITGPTEDDLEHLQFELNKGRPKK